MQDIDRSQLAWCAIGENYIFLDLENDRYFRLPQGRNQAFMQALDHSGEGHCHQPESFPLPDDWSTPDQVSPAITMGPFRLSLVARAIWVQRRVERKLAARPLASVLLDLRRVTGVRASAATASEAKACSTIRAYEQARLLRPAAGRCLPRSIALAVELAASGTTARVVIGVKLAPFAAHCWVQLGNTVLNDSVEEVLRYRPILIV